MSTTAAQKSASNVTPKGKGTAPSKAQAKAETDAKQAAQLDGLVAAVRTGMATIGTQSGKVNEAVSVALQLAEVRDNARVATARALAMLAKHDATHAKSGATKGQPSLSVIATLVGTPRNTLRPLWEGAEALTTRKWERRTSAPTQGERDIVAGFYADKVTVKQDADAAKGKGKDGKGKGSPKAGAVKKIAATLEGVVSAADVLDQTVAAFAKANGLSPAQFDALETKIGNVLVALKAVVTEPAAK